MNTGPKDEIETARAYLGLKIAAARNYLQSRGIDRASVNCRHGYEQCAYTPPPPRFYESVGGNRDRHFKE